MNSKDMNTYDRILNAGVRLFAQKGFAGTRTREIVNEAGASLSSLQQHFGSKEKIYIDAVNRAMTKYAERMAPEMKTAQRLEELGMLHGTTAWDTLCKMISKHCDWVFDPEEKEAIVLMNREMLDPHPLMGVPEESIEVMSMMSRLAQAYVGNTDSLWARLMAHNIIMTLFGVVNYPQVVGEIIGENPEAEDTREKLHLILQDYLLTSIKAYLDQRKNDSVNGDVSIVNKNAVERL